LVAGARTFRGKTQRTSPTLREWLAVAEGEDGQPHRRQVSWLPAKLERSASPHPWGNRSHTLHLVWWRWLLELRISDELGAAPARGMEGTTSARSNTVGGGAVAVVAPALTRPTQRCGDRRLWGTTVHNVGMATGRVRIG
jgi:hypothetical protein